jgi:hypothetical protein
MIFKLNVNQKKCVFKIWVMLTGLFALMGCKKDQVQQDTQLQTVAGSIKQKHLGTALATVATYNITSSLPSGYVKDGTQDYTRYVQAAINKYSNITFPAFPILINVVGLKIGSNKIITFLPGSSIILKPNPSANYDIFIISNATNVTLNNPVIVGDRYAHLDTLGQWGQGISVYASSNITINNANVSNCWGDGIYLASKNGVNNTNISIIKPVCLYNRRNGLSITSAIGLDLEAPYAAYCDGSPPYTGIDFEAESDLDELQNIVVNNPSTAHNVGNGISMGFRSLFGGKSKIISFQINNPADKSSATAFKATATLTRRVGNETITGKIIITNPVWRKNSLTPIATNLLVPTIQLSLTNPSVEDMTGAWLTDDQILSVFTYKTHINATANYSILF